MSQIAFDEEADVIVVGAGTSGCMMAHNIAKFANKKVLGLEAGDNQVANPIVRDSKYALRLIGMAFPELYWQGKSEAQSNVRGEGFQWTGGRVLGGSSSVNGEQFIKPTLDILSRWASLVSRNPFTGEYEPSSAMWKPDIASRVFNAFTKIHTVAEQQEVMGFQSSPTARSTLQHDLTGGNLHITQTPVQPTPLAQQFCDAMAQVSGFTEIQDYNDPNTPVGPFTRWSMTQSPSGVRQSSDVAFLYLDNFINTTENLKIILRATVTRILCDENRNAIGVVYLRDGIEYVARARERVILCAGIKSAKILLLSGVGDAAHLEKLGIPVVFHNPEVGRNLLNHLMVPFKFKTNPPIPGLPEGEKNAVFEGGAFLPGRNQSLDTRAYEIIYYSPQPGEMSGFILQLQPQSKGTITLQSADPLAMELVNYNYLSHPSEVKQLAECFQTYIGPMAIYLNAVAVESLVQVDLVEPSLETIASEMGPQSTHSPLEEYVLNSVTQAEHYTGACSMGRVVNPLGYVYGVGNLMVADDSVVPLTNDGNTQSTAYLASFIISMCLVERFNTGRDCPEGLNDDDDDDDTSQ
jgi:choline dehydrogenase